MPIWRPGPCQVSANGDFYHLLITFAHSLDPDQDQQNVSVGPDLGTTTTTTTTTNTTNTTTIAAADVAATSTTT